MPFSESTIKRSLKTLEAEHYIHPVRGKICWYAENMQKLRGSNPDDKGPNPDEKGPNPDGKGPNPDNYIYCSSIVDELEKNSKLKPVALVFENPADVTKADDDKIHLMHDGIAPCADGQDRKEMRHGEIASGDNEPIIHASDIPEEESGRGKVTSAHSEILNSVHEQKKELGKSISPLDIPAPQQGTTTHPLVNSFPVHMADAVEHVNSQWPMVQSLEELHQINHQYSDAVEKTRFAT